MKRSTSAFFVLGLIIVFGLSIGLVRENYIIANNNISGEGFLVQWISGRTLVTGGNSPYSDLTTAKIQQSIQNQIRIYEGGSIRYTSPLFSGVIIFSFALIENEMLARALWLTGQLFSILIIQFVGLKITGWRPKWYIFLLFSFLITFSFHVFIPWLDGGLSIWAALFLSLAFLAIRNHWNEVGGVLLALSAIQPEMTILIIIFTLIWAFTKKNNPIIVWFFMTVLTLSIVFYFLVPGWIMQYLRVIYNFTEYFPSANPGLLFKILWPGVGKQLGWVITLLTAIVLLIEWYLALKKDFRWFLWTACLTIVIGQWIGLPIEIGNYIILILPTILVSAMLSERWPRGGQWIALLIIAAVFVLEWFMFFNFYRNSQTVMKLNLIVPLPIILFIGLYWVRWWAIKAERLLIEELRLSETI